MSNETKVLTLTFGQAMDAAALEGKVVACELWDGTEQLSANPNTNRVAEADLWNPLNKEVARLNGGYANNKPYFTKVSEGDIQLGWQPTQEEMFAKWHLADVRHFLDYVTMTGNPGNRSNDLELHFYPYHRGERPKVLPYTSLYDHNLLKKGEHVVFASEDMFMNMINCLIYDSAVAFYHSRFLNSGHDGFVLKDEELANGKWKDYLQQPSHLYTLIDTRENALEQIKEAMEYSDILIGDLRTVSSEVVRKAIALVDSEVVNPGTSHFLLTDFESEMDLSVRETQDFEE